uniref:Dopey-1 n=1 Tax=Anoplopoma fimbria TaxID=229290 RepID=C3KJL0_ANOFI|nr:dopey-1 [Anoplopoma fimbria]
MNAEEVELLSDSKYRNYVAAVDKALKNFEYSSEWADLISALGKLNLLSQVFNSKTSCRTGPAYTHNSADASFPSHKEGHKLESQKVFWSRARQNIEEMVEKDFLEGLIKT